MVYEVFRELTNGVFLGLVSKHLRDMVSTYPVSAISAHSLFYIAAFFILFGNFGLISVRCLSSMATREVERW